MPNKKFNPIDITVGEFGAMIPMFDSYITYPAGKELTEAQCFDMYDEESSIQLLGDGNLEYRDYDCSVCAYMSQLPIEVFKAINDVFEYGMELDDFEMLQTPISDVIEVYTNNAHLYH